MNLPFYRRLLYTTWCIKLTNINMCCFLQLIMPSCCPSRPCVECNRLCFRLEEREFKLRDIVRLARGARTGRPPTRITIPVHLAACHVSWGSMCVKNICFLLSKRFERSLLFQPSANVCGIVPAERRVLCRYYDLRSRNDHRQSDTRKSNAGFRRHKIRLREWST
jgi:hypothetical protein